MLIGEAPSSWHRMPHEIMRYVRKRPPLMDVTQGSLTLLRGLAFAECGWQLPLPINALGGHILAGALESRIRIGFGATISRPDIVRRRSGTAQVSRTVALSAGTRGPGGT